jgi:hypothetical protein
MEEPIGVYQKVHLLCAFSEITQFGLNINNWCKCNLTSLDGKQRHKQV